MITPIYQILLNGADINSLIEDKFISLTIVDKIGLSADTLDLTLNFDGTYTIPRAGVVLGVKIGYAEEGLWPKNFWKFVVEETNFTGGADAADTLNIRGTSIPESPQAAVGALQGATERVWQSFDIDGTTFKTIVDEVCSDAGLTAKIDPTLAAIQMPFTAQLNESDAEFLHRITIIRDGIIKYHDTQVIIEKKDSDKLGTLNIPKTNTITSYEFTNSERTKVASVVSKYQDANAGEVIKYTAGSGKPRKVIRQTFPDRKSAVDAAESLLKQLQRETVDVQIVMPTVVGLLAEKVINLSDFPDASLNSEYIIESVTHKLHNTAGLSSTIKARKRG